MHSNYEIDLFQALIKHAAELTGTADLDNKSLRVIVQGRLKSRSFETREGERRTVFEVDVDEIGPSLRYATAKVQRTPSGGGQSSGWGQASQPRQSQPQGQDPWASSPAASSDEAPF